MRAASMLEGPGARPGARPGAGGYHTPTALALDKRQGAVGGRTTQFLTATA